VRHVYIFGKMEPKAGKTIYQELADTLRQIRPSTGRAGSALQKLILHCDADADREIGENAKHAAGGGLRFEFSLFILEQGADAEHKSEIAKADSLISELARAVA
jgi:hypothetical protein